LRQRSKRGERIWKDPLILIVVLVVIWLAVDAALSLAPHCYDLAKYASDSALRSECRPALPGPLSIGIWLWLGENRDAVIAIAALVVAVFAAALYGATRSLGRIANEQLAALDVVIETSKEAAAAAAKSADVVIRLERSWLFVDKYRLSSDDGYATPNNWTIVLRWRNVGRAPAVVEEFILKILDIDALPPMPDYSDASLIVCNAHAVMPGQVFVTQRVGPSSAIAMKNGKPVRFVTFGKITYRQLSGVRHSTGFALSVAPDRPGAGVYRNDAYNYWN
jgi:hypothetical protein